MTFSLLVTSSPSPPVPCPWSLKLRIVLSGPWPRTVTSLTSSESVARKSNRPSPSSMTSPGLALIIAAWIRFAASVAGLDPGRTGHQLARIGRIDLDAMRLLLTAGDEQRGTSQGRGGNVHDAHVRPPRRSPVPAGPAHDPRLTPRSEAGPRTSVDSMSVPGSPPGAAAGH